MTVQSKAKQDRRRSDPPGRRRAEADPGASATRFPAAGRNRARSAAGQAPTAGALADGHKARHGSGIELEADAESREGEELDFIETIAQEGYFSEEELGELVRERPQWPQWSYLRLDQEQRRAGRRALVTGGAGFIGSHVAELLLERGYRVLVVDDLSSGLIENVPEGAHFEEINIVDEVRIYDAIYHFCPDCIFHLAAQASVTVSVQNPYMDFYPNVAGTFNVLESARSRKARLVFASTGGALYGEEAPLPTDEDFPPDPLSPYGIAKLCCEIYLTRWNRLYGCQNTVLRLANVYGPRQNPHGEAGVVAIFSNALHNGLTPRIYGDGEQTRDYIHVRDVAEAFIAAAERTSPGIYNVGTGVQTSVKQLLEVLQGAAASSARAEYLPPRLGELRRSALDAARMRETFGWEPKVGLEEGLAQTFAHYAGGLPRS